MIKFITNKLFYLPFVYIIIGILVYILISKAIKKISKYNINNKGLDKRKTTIINLIRSIIQYIIAIIVIIMILNLYGVNTTSIIASLGVASLVIGLAFQDILKDIFFNLYKVNYF